MSLSAVCVNSLTNAGVLASIVKRNARSEITFSPTVAGVGQIEQTLKANGVAALFTSMPLSGSVMMTRLAETSLVAGFLAAIYSAFKVNLLAPFKPGRPGQATLLISALRTKLAGKDFSLPVHPVLPADPTELKRLSQLAFAAGALRQNAGVDLFGKSGGKDLTSFFGHPSTVSILSQLRRTSFSAGTVGGLSALSSAAAGPAALARLFGHSTSGIGIAPHQLTLSALGAPHLALLWPSISSGIIASGIQLPDPVRIATVNSQKATLKMLESMIGLKVSDKRFPSELATLSNSLERNNICAALAAHPLRATELQHLNHLVSVSSGIDNATKNLGVNLLDRNAGDTLRPKIDRLLGNPSQSGLQLHGNIVGSLGRLASLAHAI